MSENQPQIKHPLSHCSFPRRVISSLQHVSDYKHRETGVAPPVTASHTQPREFTRESIRHVGEAPFFLPNPPSCLTTFGFHICERHIIP